MKKSGYFNIIKYSIILSVLLLVGCNKSVTTQVDYSEYNIKGEVPITKEVQINLDEQMVLDATLSETEVVIIDVLEARIYTEPGIETDVTDSAEVGDGTAVGELTQIVVSKGDSFEVSDVIYEDDGVSFYEVYLEEGSIGYIQGTDCKEGVVEQLEIKQYKIFEVIGTYWYESGLVIVYSSTEKNQYDLVYYNPESNEAMTLYTGDRAVNTLLDVVDTDTGLGFCFDGEILFLDRNSLDNIGRVFLEQVTVGYEIDNDAVAKISGESIEYVVGKSGVIYYVDGNQVIRRFPGGEEELYYSYADSEAHVLLKNIDLSKDETRLIFAIEEDNVNTSWIAIDVESRVTSVYGIYESDLIFSYSHTAVGYDYRKNNGLFTVDFKDGDRIEYVSNNYSTESFMDKVHGSDLIALKDHDSIVVFDPQYNKVINSYRTYKEVDGYLNIGFVGDHIKVMGTKGDLINIYSFETGYKHLEQMAIEITPGNSKGYIVEDTFVSQDFVTARSYQLANGDGLSIHESNVLELERSVALSQGSYFLDKWNRMSSLSEYYELEGKLPEHLTFDRSDSIVAYLNMDRNLVVLDSTLESKYIVDRQITGFRVFEDLVFFTVGGEGVYYYDGENEIQLLDIELSDYGYQSGFLYYSREEEFISLNIDTLDREVLLEQDIVSTVYNDEIVICTLNNDFYEVYYIVNGQPVFVRLLPIEADGALEYSYLYNEEFYYGDKFGEGDYVLQSTPLDIGLLNGKVFYSDERIIMYTYNEYGKVDEQEIIALYDKEIGKSKVLTKGQEMIKHQLTDDSLFIFSELDSTGLLYQLNLTTLDYRSMYNIEGDIVKVSDDGSKVATMSYNVGWNFNVFDTITGEVLYEKKYADLITSNEYGVFITVGQQIIRINLDTMNVRTLVYDCRDGYNAKTFIHHNKSRDILYYHSINDVLYALDMKTLKATYVFSECVQIFRFVSDDTGFNKIYLLGGNGLIYNYNGESIIPLNLKEIVDFSKNSKDTDFKDLVTRYGSNVIYTNTVDGTIHAYNEKTGKTTDLLRISNENVEFRKVSISIVNGVQKLLIVYYSPTLSEVELYLELDDLK